MDSVQSSYTGADELEIMSLAVRYNDALLDSILAYLPADSKRVLDFGAGTGLFLDKVRNALPTHVEVQALEVDPKLVSLIRDRAPDVFVCSDLNAVATGSLDYIYSLNVLEHIEDDFSTLMALRSKLKPGGQLYLYVPAFMCLYSSNDRKVGHVRRYRLKALRDLLVRAGFEPLQGRYCDPLGFFATLVFKWFDRKKTGDIDPKALVIFDRCIFPISRWFEPIFSRVLGKNAQWVARNPG